MARYSVSVESSAAIGSGTAFANIVAGASAGFRLRRVTVGCRAGTSSVTAMQAVVGVYRATARGTASTTAAGIALDPISPASAITGVDTAWSVAPTVAAAPMWEIPLNTAAVVDIPWEDPEAIRCSTGTANGIALVCMDNALPASTQFVVTVEWEE